MRIFVQNKLLYKAMCGGVLLSLFSLVGCASIDTGALAPQKKHGYPLSERACLERVMYFESNRSSREGMIAVGTVVMNRVHSSAYPNTICGVVGEAKQFAPGVLTRPMTETRSLERAREAASAVLRGERTSKLKNAMFFHTAGLKFPYRNMHYVEVAGGNAFYEKRNRDGSLQVPVRDSTYDIAYALQQEGMQPSAKRDEAMMIMQAYANEPATSPAATASIDLVQTGSVELGYTEPSQKKLSEIGSSLLRNRKN